MIPKARCLRFTRTLLVRIVFFTGVVVSLLILQNGLASTSPHKELYRS
jgi:hypothetical protein